MSVTISDVAKKACVSISSVSRVINGAPNVDDEICEKVQNAIRELGYTPNMFAQSLRHNRSKSIGILTTDITVSFSARFVHRMENRLMENLYIPVFADTYDKPEIEKNALKLLTARRVEALVICSTGKNEKMIMDIKETGVPVILYDRYSRQYEFPTVYVNKRAGIYKALSYLHQLGHKKIAFITGDKSVSTNYDRFLGIQDFSYDFNVNTNDLPCMFGDFTAEYAEKAIDELMRLPEPPTAVVTGSVANTEGILSYCKKKGLNVPNELSLVSFGSFSHDELIVPALTYVEDMSESIADRVYDLLLPIIKGEENEDMHSIVLEPDLILGGSCSSR